MQELLKANRERGGGPNQPPLGWAALGQGWEHSEATWAAPGAPTAYLSWWELLDPWPHLQPPVGEASADTPPELGEIGSPRGGGCGPLLTFPPRMWQDWRGWKLGSWVGFSCCIILGFISWLHEKGFKKPQAGAL